MELWVHLFFDFSKSLHLNGSDKNFSEGISHLLSESLVLAFLVLSDSVVKVVEDIFSVDPEVFSNVSNEDFWVLECLDHGHEVFELLDILRLVTEHDCSIHGHEGG